MRVAILTAFALTAALPLAPVRADPPPWSNAGGNKQHGNDNGKNHKNNNKASHTDYSRYDYNRPDPRYGAYQANRYYVDNGRYQSRKLGPDDRIYRGQDNRYYCRRSDGTTGLIIGGISGGVLGNLIAPNGSKTLGSLLGGGLGAVIGNSIDSQNVTCR